MADEVADVLLVGSGAAGGPFAWHLTAAGLKVVCLEQGDWIKKPGPSSEADNQEERLKQPAPPKRPGVMYFKNGYPYDHTQSYWQPILGNAVGGGTIHYGGTWNRLHPSEFTSTTPDGREDNWPIRYSDLASYYDQIDNLVGVAGLPNNPAFPPRSVNFLPPHRPTRSSEVLSRGFKKLNWHQWPIERAVITKPFRGRRPCVNNCTSCDDGCPLEAKNTSDVVFLREAVKNGLVLKTRATVREITTDARGRATGARYFDAVGRVHEQKARLVVLACNGIGTPRLLLNSRSRLFPNGLANNSGQVGKNLMAHPGARVVGRFSEDVADFDELTNGICSEQFAESDPKRGFVRGVWMSLFGFLGPVGMALGDQRASPATIVPVAYRPAPGDGRIPWGAAHHSAFEQRALHTIGVSLLCDEVADPGNRVELDPTLVDDFGIPAPKLFMKRTQNAERALTFGMERAREALEASGAVAIETASMGAAAPGHYLGTTIMGLDPKTSVVDGWGRTHDVPNLFVIDGSVFRTSGSNVPTATIQAIALRTADYIKKNAKKLVVPSSI